MLNTMGTDPTKKEAAKAIEVEYLAPKT